MQNNISEDFEIHTPSSKKCIYMCVCVCVCVCVFVLQLQVLLFFISYNF